MWGLSSKSSAVLSRNVSVFRPSACESAVITFHQPQPKDRYTGKRQSAVPLRQQSSPLGTHVKRSAQDKNQTKASEVLGLTPDQSFECWFFFKTTLLSQITDDADPGSGLRTGSTLWLHLRESEDWERDSVGLCFSLGSGGQNRQEVRSVGEIEEAQTKPGPFR